jgi:hypothetical protein
MTKAAAWTAGHKITLGLADLVGLRITRNVCHDVYARYRSRHGRPEGHQCIGHQAVRHEREALTGRGYIIDRVERRCWISIQPVTGDDREWPGFCLTQAEWAQFWRGEVTRVSTEPMGDVDRAYASYHWRGLEFEMLDYSGTFRRLRLEVPRELVQAAIGKVMTLGYGDRYGRNTTRLVPITERHKAFWSPNARIVWEGEVYDAYQARKDWAAGYAGSDRTLADLIEDKLQQARNRSRSQADSYSVHVHWEKPNNFVWTILRDRDNAFVYNGGLIWRGDHYSSHT